MSNQIITSEDYNMQMTLFPETDEKNSLKDDLLLPLNLTTTDNSFYL